MIPTPEQLCRLIHDAVGHRVARGYDMTGIEDQLARVGASYDALLAVAAQAAARPLRDDWPYVEPTDIEQIKNACDPAREMAALPGLDLDAAACRVREGFLASVCGCQLGKPIEVNPTLAELRRALEAVGQWPISDYISEKALAQLGQRHESWIQTARERLCWAAPDDDINYTILAMLLLETHGSTFTAEHVAQAWFAQLPGGITFAEERKRLAAIMIARTCGGRGQVDPVTEFLVVGDVWCGAQIRADAYGYAAAGRPELAAALAWRDAALTHVGTGGYAAMWTAAAIATACVVDDPLEVCRIASQYIPQQSRFAEAVRRCQQIVADADGWLDGYERLHCAFQEYNHCRVLQETGTLINTLRFADSVGDGLCKQVMQGNDTDSYAATAGAILGCLFSPGSLERRWLEPLHDTLHTGLADFHEQCLSAVAERMAALPRQIAEELDRID